MSLGTRSPMRIRVSTPRSLLRAVLAALSQGTISEAVVSFGDHFTFNDRALGLEFTDRDPLTEFFKHSRKLFPDTALEVVSSYESGDTAFAEWKLTATWPTYSAVKLEVVAGEIPQAKLETPARVAHEKICPCSHTTRGNIEADLTVVGVRISVSSHAIVVGTGIHHTITET